MAKKRLKNKYYANKNISGTNLLLVPFGFDSKKLGKKSLILCISIMLLFVYKYS